MTEAEIGEWLAKRIARAAGVEAEDIDRTQPFASYGLDSTTMVTVAGELETLLERRLDPVLLYSMPNIDSLVRFLGGSSPSAQHTIDDPTAPAHEPIAIIGAACRFPGARDLREFWSLLSEGRDAVGEIPASRFHIEQFYDAEPTVPGRISTRRGGFLDDVAGFDAKFFGMKTAEAASTDPQHRLLLELSYEALEDAGQPRENLAGRRVGTFVGISGSEYGALLGAVQDEIGAYSATGSSLAVAANRIAYFFDFSGPSLAVDAACASSLVAVHLACQSLRNGESEVALAAGVNLLLTPDGFIALSKAGMMAPDGRCKAFDARADGYVRGEGAAVVVLKPLEQALYDRDPVRALILGTAVNQDGRSNGLTAPNPRAQVQVVRDACQDAGIDPTEIQFLEAHGTGTYLGDPIEAKAIGSVLGSVRPSHEPRRIGSVKTNIGHLEAAAGIAGLLKTVLSLAHRAIPPSLNFSKPNPLIDFEALGLEVPTRLTPFATDGRALAGVSSFGFGGTNAHVVLADSPMLSAAREEPEGAARSVALLPLSAHTPVALRERARDLADWLEGPEPPALEALCYTAAARRSHHRHRLAVVGRSTEEMVVGLREYRPETGGGASAVGGTGRPHPREVLFVFSGQGTQWPRMALDLLQREPVFGTMFSRCDTALSRHADWSLRQELERSAAESRLGRTEIAQPAIFAVQVALSELWRSWGIEPVAVVGHSVGEIAAALVAGVLELDDAMKIAITRGRLMQEAHGHGGMLAVALTADEIRGVAEEYDDSVSLAAVNGPGATVLSGERGALEEIARRLEESGIAIQTLPVDYAFHSAQMDLFVRPFREALAGIVPQEGTLPFYSTLTGVIEKGEGLDGDYWARGMRECVHFAAAFGAARAAGLDTFLEIGSHPVLGSSMTATLAASAQDDALIVSSLRRDSDGSQALFASLARLYAAGCDVRWDGLHPMGGEVVPLPEYPWQRTHSWALVPPTPIQHPTLSGDPGAADSHPLLGRLLDLAGEEGPLIWQSNLRFDEPEFLQDHRLGSSVTFPAAAYVELALAATVELGRGPALALEDLTLHEFLFLDEDRGVTLQVHFVSASKDSSGRGRLRIFSRQDGEEHWTLHATASITPHSPLEDSAAVDSLAKIQARCLSQVAPPQLYRELTERGLRYGPAFRLLRDIWFGEREALVRVRSMPADAHRYSVAPPVMDACFQSVAATLMADEPGNHALFVPVGVERIRLGGTLPESFRVHVVERPAEGDEGAIRVADLSLRGEEGELLGEIRGLRLRHTAAGVVRADTLDVVDTPKERLWFYRTAWREKPLAPTRSPGAEGRWLILADRGGVGRDLALRLAEQSGTTREVVLGEETGGKRRPSTTYLDPVRPDLLRQLLQEELSPEQPPLRGIVHLWSLDTLAPAREADGANEDPHWAGVGSVLQVVQELLRPVTVELPRLWIVTCGAQANEERQQTVVAPLQAPILGLSRVLALESPDLTCNTIDLDPEQPRLLARDLVRELLAENVETHTILRGERRYVPRLIPDDSLEVGGEESTPIVADATYLVTGGLGGLGLLVAAWLVESGARHVVLLGRSEPPDEVGAVLDDLRAQGAEIIVAQGDVTQRDAVADLLERIADKLPPLRGVVHAAGILEDRALQDLDRERLYAVMAPKVEGAWNLHELTADAPLDFFVLFSSAAAILGSPGQGNYAAGNAFLDALAHLRYSQDLPALSINWGPWAEVGLAGGLDGAFESLPGVSLIAPARGIAALRGLLGRQRAQALVLPFDLSSLLHLYPVATGLAFFEELFREDMEAVRSIGPTAGVEARPDLQQDYVAPRDDVERVVGRIWQRAIGIDRVGMHDSFFDLGGDSLFANQIVVQIGKTFGVRIDSRRAYEAFTVEHIARMIWEALLSEVEQMSAAAVGDSLVGTIGPTARDGSGLVYSPELAGRVAALSSEQTELLKRWARGRKRPGPSGGPTAGPLDMGEVILPGLAQARMFRKMENEEATDRNHFHLVRLSGNLELQAMRDAVANMVRRHENLRTTFVFGNDEPEGRISTEMTVELPFEDLGHLGLAEAEREAVRLGTLAGKRPYDLENGPLIRSAVFRLAEREHVFLMAAHLIVFDLWSMGVVVGELTALYNAFVEGRPSPLPDLPIQYRDFVRWQRRWLDGEDAHRQLAYWRQQLLDLPSPVALPGRGAAASEEVAFREGLISIVLAPGLSELVGDFSRGRGVSTYMTLLAAFQVLVSDLTGATDFLVGMPIANRNQPGVENLIGYFPNVLPIRGDLNADPSFEQVLEQVKRNTTGAYEHQDLPFDRYWEEVVPGQPAEAPLVRLLFSVQNVPIPSFDMRGLESRPLHLNYGVVSPFDLVILLIESDVLVDGRGELAGYLHYNANLFEQDMMRTLWKKYCEALEYGLRYPERPISELEGQIHEA